MKLILLFIICIITSCTCTINESLVIQNDWGIITGIKTVGKNRYEVTVNSGKDTEFTFYTSIAHNVNDTIKIR